jgi:lipase
VRLHVHEWGDPDAPPLVCLHGVTGHGRRFRKLAEERLARSYRVLAPDLRGHGRSSWEPPWRIETQLADVLETLELERATWLGHSFGGRLLLELAAREPERIERAVLLDPAVQLLPHVAFDLAEAERREVAAATVDEAIERKIVSSRLQHTPRQLLEEEMAEHLERGRDGLLRYRYSQACVGYLFAELALAPPPYECLQVPTLLVLGAQSYLVLEEQQDALQAALGALLETRAVRGGHSVLWDAFPETADALEAFLATHEE